MSAWKAAERECAKLLGGRRRVRASYSDSIEDVYHPTLSIECKYGNQVPDYCKVSVVTYAGDWVLIPSWMVSSGRVGGEGMFRELPSGSYEFIRKGIAQAISYNPDKVPVLCVKPRRYVGLVVILRASDYRSEGWRLLRTQGMGE